VFGLDLAMRLFLFRRLLERTDLVFRQDQAVLRNPRRERLQALLERLQICRSWRNQIVRTPAGDTEIARFFSSLATRTWP